MHIIKAYLIGILLLSFGLTLNSQTSNIVINEFMAKNTTYAQDENGQFDDYIELRNNSSTDWISLKNWTLTDTLGIPDKWTFPDEVSIAPHGYLVLWADEDGGQGDLHINFKLDGDGEELYLFNHFGNMVDKIIFGEQVEDMSFSRVPNGVGDFIIKDGTIGFNNEDTSSLNDELKDQYKIYPNPASDLLYIENLKKLKTQVRIFDLIGNEILSYDISKSTGNIDISSLTSGMYIITLNGSLSDRLIKL